MSFWIEGKRPILCKQKDCFAYNTERICKILKEPAERNGKCVFYKTKKEYEEGLKKYGGPKI